uniref:Uncharacterized protein n=1 Tax=Amphimedon queenslandica TaxID=400682 RepID=A0A1X7SMY5_AMPQE
VNWGEHKRAPLRRSLPPSLPLYVSTKIRSVSVMNETESEGGTRLLKRRKQEELAGMKRTLFVELRGDWWEFQTQD